MRFYFSFRVPAYIFDVYIYQLSARNCRKEFRCVFPSVPGRSAADARCVKRAVCRMKWTSGLWERVRKKKKVALPWRMCAPRPALNRSIDSRPSSSRSRRASRARTRLIGARCYFSRWRTFLRERARHPERKRTPGLNRAGSLFPRAISSAEKRRREVQRNPGPVAEKTVRVRATPNASRNAVVTPDWPRCKRVIFNRRPTELHHRCYSASRDAASAILACGLCAVLR